MKTAYGRLALLAFGLMMAALLFLPMRAGDEDQLVLEPVVLKMSVGDSYTLRCALSAEDTNQQLYFVSDDTQIATIDGSGTVHAVSSGETVIRAVASGGASAETQIVVDGIPMTQLQLNVDELHIKKGQYSGLSVSYNSDASDTRLQWISSDENIVKVDNSGRVEGVGGGEAYVSVVAPNGRSDSAKVYVDVEGTAVHISPNSITLGVGAHVPLKVSYLPVDCTDQVRRWVSSNPSVLSVDENGVLDAKNMGSAYITVLTEDGLTTGMEVRVEAAPKDLQLDPSRATLERGDSLQMQLKFLEEDGTVDEETSHLVVWSSSDESVATVDKKGLVTALKSGRCQISATSDGITATCQLQVEVNVRQITLNQSEVYLLPEQLGAPIQLQWIVDPVDADDPTVTFVSDNEQVATVDSNGLVTFSGGYGTAVITASAASGAACEFVANVVTALPDSEPEVVETPVPVNAAPYEEIYEEIYEPEDEAPVATPIVDGEMVVPVNEAPDSTVPEETSRTVG